MITLMNIGCNEKRYDYNLDLVNETSVDYTINKDVLLKKGFLESDESQGQEFLGRVFGDTVVVLYQLDLTTKERVISKQVVVRFQKMDESLSNVLDIMQLKKLDNYEPNNEFSNYVDFYVTTQNNDTLQCTLMGLGLRKEKIVISTIPSIPATIRERTNPGIEKHEELVCKRTKFKN